MHIGNFREIISTELVVRALRDRGKAVRFLYSWDDYDVFRKVPKNMPDQELLAKFLRQPITLVPDTLGRAENYARGNEKDLEALLPLVGVAPEYLYQAERYTEATTRPTSATPSSTAARSAPPSTPTAPNPSKRAGGPSRCSASAATATTPPSRAGTATGV